MPVIIKTSFLLIMSNLFMTFAWYAHLKNLADKKWYIAARCQLGHRLLRIYDPGARKPHRLFGAEPVAA
jgi:uncharacterized protein (DUF486 family)